MIEVLREQEKKISRAVLIGIQDKSITSAEAKEHIAELSELASTLGIDEKIIVNVILRQICSKFLLGSGKAQEIATLVSEKKAECIIFDYELSPSQQRNWEALVKIPVLDRQELIIDIFAQHAQTKEATLQVELAKLQYTLPRLKRAWTHLSRQRGGLSTMRGEGEQQIEMDRRIIKNKIASLKKSLDEIASRRKLERKLSEKNQIPRAAIVGYTNAGKSSLLKILTNADVYIEDKLFATLDTTSRKLILPDGQQIIISDTVGFIRKLPHNLVEAFKSTLEEAVFADLLIHVLDISSPFWEEHMKTTLSVLNELGAGDKEIITALNKCDIQTDPFTRSIIKSALPDAILISAKTGEGIENLKSVISERLHNFNSLVKLKIPPEKYEIVALAYNCGKVLKKEYSENAEIILEAIIPKNQLAKFKPYLQT